MRDVGTSVSTVDSQTAKPISKASSASKIIGSGERRRLVGVSIVLRMAAFCPTRRPYV